MYFVRPRLCLKSEQGKYLALASDAHFVLVNFRLKIFTDNYNRNRNYIFIVIIDTIFFTDVTRLDIHLRI